jgi:hypothetical protein
MVKGHDQSNILIRVRKAFSVHRRRNGSRQRYSQSLRNLVVSALEKGCSSGQIASAAGISEPSVRNWSNHRPLIAVRELRVEPDKIERVEEGTAKIHLKSGVRIEIPMSSLTASLVSALGGAI